ncbi:hypothetical protein GCM10020258_14190 [Sphingomonas yabuuchiae]
MKAIALGLMLAAGTVAVAQQKPAAPAKVPAYVAAALADPARADQAGTTNGDRPPPSSPFRV